MVKTVIFVSYLTVNVDERPGSEYSRLEQACPHF